MNVASGSTVPNLAASDVTCLTKFVHRHPVTGPHKRSDIAGSTAIKTAIAEFHFGLIL